MELLWVADVISTRRRLYEIFLQNQRSIIQSIFSKYSSLENDHVVSNALIQLRQAIIQDVINKELLIPFGRALACSLALQNDDSDAVDVL